MKSMQPQIILIMSACLKSRSVCILPIDSDFRRRNLRIAAYVLHMKGTRNLHGLEVACEADKARTEIGDR